MELECGEEEEAGGAGCEMHGFGGGRGGGVLDLVFLCGRGIWWKDVVVS